MTPPPSNLRTAYAYCVRKRVTENGGEKKNKKEKKKKKGARVLGSCCNEVEKIKEINMELKHLHLIQKMN